MDLEPSDLLPISEVALIIRVLAGICALELSLAERRRQLLVDLCKLIQADGWFSSTRSRSLSAGPLDSTQLIENASNLCDATVLQWLRDDLIPENDASHPSRIHIHHSPAEGLVSTMSLYRGESSDPFSKAQLDLAHGLIRNVVWLHPVTQENACDSLSDPLNSRAHDVLHLLMQGVSRKQIAWRLGISPFTVGDYMKAIYRRYGVTSRLQLMRQLAVQGGQDERQR